MLATRALGQDFVRSGVDLERLAEHLRALRAAKTA
jgi:hypothetical protein